MPRAPTRGGAASSTVPAPITRGRRRVPALYQTLVQFNNKHGHRRPTGLETTDPFRHRNLNYQAWKGRDTHMDLSQQSVATTSHLGNRTREFIWHQDPTRALSTQPPWRLALRHRDRHKGRIARDHLKLSATMPRASSASIGSQGELHDAAELAGVHGSLIGHGIQQPMDRHANDQGIEDALRSTLSGR